MPLRFRRSNGRTLAFFTGKDFSHRFGGKWLMKWKTNAAACAVLLSFSSLSAQEPAQDSFLQWMNQIAQEQLAERDRDRKSTRLNSSHGYSSYAVFCLKKKRCGRRRHLAGTLSLRGERGSPDGFGMAATGSISSIVSIKLIRVSLGTVRHPRRFKIGVIDIQITLKQMLRDFIGIRVKRAKKSGMGNITSSVNSRERTFFFNSPPDPQPLPSFHTSTISI